MGSCLDKLQSEHPNYNSVKDVSLPSHPNGLLPTRSLPPRLSIVEQANEFVEIDKLLGGYYQQFGIKNYFNQITGNGRFLQYIIDHKFININLSYYNESDNFEYIHFDKEFPINNDTLIYLNKHHIDKKQVIFYVIQYCFKYSVYPTPNRYLQYMVVDTPRTSFRPINKSDGDHDDKTAKLKQSRSG